MSEIKQELKGLLPALVRQTREGLGLTLDEFAIQLCARLEGGLTRQGVWNWENGKNQPQVSFLIEVTVSYPRADWRYQFANDCLAALMPHWGYAPLSEWGRGLTPGPSPFAKGANGEGGKPPDSTSSALPGPLLPLPEPGRVFQTTRAGVNPAPTDDTDDMP